MKASAIALLLLSALGTAHATLNDLGNGLVADTDQGIYWLRDANIVHTACHASSGPEKALWDAFDPENNPGGMGQDDWGLPRNKQSICDFGGAMRPAEAEVWIQIMNQQAYLGFSNWRLPSTPQPDPTCETQRVVPPYPNQGVGYNCRGSELGYLFNISLGNPNHGGTGATGGTVGTGCDDAIHLQTTCLVNSGPFFNTTNYAGPNVYWSTQYEPDTNRYWRFNFINGAQYPGSFEGNLQAWPVRSPEHQPVTLFPPFALVILSSLLALLGLYGRRLQLFRDQGV